MWVAPFLIISPRQRQRYGKVPYNVCAAESEVGTLVGCKSAALQRLNASVVIGGD
jgi:hypothetical protein